MRKKLQPVLPVKVWAIAVGRKIVNVYPPDVVKSSIGKPRGLGRFVRVVVRGK